VDTCKAQGFIVDESSRILLWTSNTGINLTGAKPILSLDLLSGNYKSLWYIHQYLMSASYGP